MGGKLPSLGGRTWLEPIIKPKNVQAADAVSLRKDDSGVPNDVKLGSCCPLGTTTSLLSSTGWYVPWPLCRVVELAGFAGHFTRAPIHTTLF